MRSEQTMGFLYTLSKVVIPIAILATIGLWIALTAIATKRISWNDKYSVRGLLFNLDANQLSESQRDRLISNAVGMEVLHLLVHMLPFIAMLIGVLCNHYYAVHCMASFSLISLIYDDFDVVNRWNYLLDSTEDRAPNVIYILSHFLHILTVFAAILFSHFILRPKQESNRNKN